MVGSVGEVLVEQGLVQVCRLLSVKTAGLFSVQSHVTGIAFLLKKEQYKLRQPR